MNYLTAIENDFLNSLKVDHKNRKEKSFFSVLFLGAYIKGDKELLLNIKNNIDLEEYKKIDKKGYDILNETEWLFESMESRMVGKYKNHFIGTASEGEYFSMGLEIQNLPVYIISASIADIDEPDERENIVDFFLEELQIDFENYLQEYEKFCDIHGLIFQGNLQYILDQVKNIPLL